VSAGVLWKGKKEVFVSKCKVWKLKEPELQQAFKANVREIGRWSEG